MVSLLLAHLWRIFAPQKAKEGCYERLKWHFFQENSLFISMCDTEVIQEGLQGVICYKSSG